MNKIPSVLSSVQSVEYHKNYLIVKCENQKYYCQKIDYSLSKLLTYFQKIDFSYVGPLTHYDDHYLLYCINQKEEKNDLKGKKLIQVLSSLHQKSVIIKEYSLEEKQKKYDFIHSMIESRMKYYLSLQDEIDEYYFPPPAYYLFIKNISKVYSLLHYAFQQLDIWYQNEKLEYRDVFLIHNVCFDNFHFGDSCFFYDYGNENRGEPIYDVLSFFRKELFEIDLDSLFSLYQEVFPLRDEEISLFFCMLAIPDEISFQNYDFQNTILVRKFVNSIDKISSFLLEKNEENQETNENEFNK